MKTVSKAEVQPVAELVDRLGTLRAAIAPLQTEAEDIEGKLKAAGPGAYAGILFDATVYAYNREIVQWKAIAYKVGFSSQLKTAYSDSVRVIGLTLTARKVSS